MATIRERILARPDLQQARLDRSIDILAAGLNEECQPVDIPTYHTANSILESVPMAYFLVELLQDAAAGQDVQARAQALLTEPGAIVLAPGFEPPMVDRMEVAYAMYNDDGSEKEPE